MKLKQFSYADVDRDRAKAEKFLARFVDPVTTLSEEAFQELVGRVVSWLKPEPEDDIPDRISGTVQVPEIAGQDPAESVRKILSPLFGRNLRSRQAEEAAWRMGALRRRFQRGLPVADAFPAGAPERWDALLIESAAARMRGQGGACVDVAFRVYTGPCAGLWFLQSIPYKYALYGLGREAGIPRYAKPSPEEKAESLRVHPGDLAGFRLQGLLDFSEPRPRAARFEVSEGSKGFNAALASKRRKPCIRELPLECHACPAGRTGGDACARATHVRPWVQRQCISCHQESWFEHGSRADVCLACAERQAARSSRYSVTHPLSSAACGRGCFTTFQAA